MKRRYIICMVASIMTTAGIAQDIKGDTVFYRGEMLGSASTGGTPFWMASNRYGLVPLDAPNGYFSTGVFYKGRSGDLRWEAGLDMVAITPRYRNVAVRQLYGELVYKRLQLNIGSKEQYVSLWDKELSSGDMVMSANARPIPEAKVSIPDYAPVPYAGEWVQIKGSFGTGRSLDAEYLKHFTNPDITYVKDVLWHYKSLYFRIRNARKSFPLSLEFGLQHGAQWGGTSTNPKIGKQPQSLTDYARVILGMSGDENATMSDQINVLGNQYGSYDFRLSYIQAEWNAQTYHQRYFEDKSGMEFLNSLDGLWGVQLNLPSSIGWVRKIVFEILETRNQTGPFHFIEFDHKAHPGIGGGNDNYYNNGEYVTGLSYFNRGLGSPLLPSPEYNDGSLGFADTRVHNLHLGLSGNLSRAVGYRLLFTSMKSWGRHEHPYLNTKTGFSGLCEIIYHPARLNGWTFTGMLAADRGNYLKSKGIGGGITISRRGILPIIRTR